MTIEAKVICDSVVGYDRLTTMQLRYPRFIHAEFMTHRVFSRNASSSRAIPVDKVIGSIMLDPAIPVHWGKNQPGMQAEHEHDAMVSIPTDTGGCEDVNRVAAWLAARDAAVKFAEAFSTAGYHKQIVNRILEPFSHITVLVTSDQWANFFALRNHPDAQPEIRELAVKMQEALTKSVPNQLQEGDWHLPYITENDVTAVYEMLKKRSLTRSAPDQKEVCLHMCAISAARCARVSYLTHDGRVPDMEEDLKLYFRLVNAEPPHMSPCEHQAIHDRSDLKPGNFRNWLQFRHVIHGNTFFDPT